MKIKIFSRENCRFCEETIALLTDKGIEFDEFKIETTDERIQLKEKFPKAKTYPVIVIDDVWIGGYTQLLEHLRNQ